MTNRFLSNRFFYFVAALCSAALLVAACSGDDKDPETNTSSNSTNTITTTSPPTSSGQTTSTSQSGTGGTIDPQKVCDEGEKKIIDCGGKFPGQGGAGGTAGFVECDDVDVCRAQCALDAPCSEIKFSAADYADCLYCCDNPHLCS